jgi:predicted TIM-barrel fold metal-dependent hydrolase
MIIDTESHVLRFARSYTNNPDNKSYGMVRHLTWHEHSTELFVAEMDNAGVDKAFLISYDAEDTRWSAEQKGYAMEDYSGGKKYTLMGAAKYPDRFLWFNTVKDPKLYDSAELVRRDAELGMVGIKLFPAFIQTSLADPGLRRVFDACRDLDLRVLISFEVIRPPKTLSLSEYLVELDALLAAYPTVQFALLHVGCADPLGAAAEQVFSIVKRYPNVYLSTAFPGEVWDDGTEYPYPNYLRRIQRTCEAVGANRVMWATDWPWFDWAFKYEQGVNAIRKHANFLTESEKASFLGQSAVEFMGPRINDQVKIPPTWLS